MTAFSIPAVPRFRSRFSPRFGLRAGVLAISALLVAGTAVVVASNVSDHLAQAAIHEAVRTTESVVLGSMNPPVTATAIANPGGTEGQAINAELQRLVGG